MRKASACFFIEEVSHAIRCSESYRGKRGLRWRADRTDRTWFHGSRRSDGKTNLSSSDVGGSLLLVSQFTLLADCRKGNRPSFIKAGSPEHAEAIYDYIVKLCRDSGIETACGVFGADMRVSLVNEGPFTIVLDSDELLKPRHS